MLRKKPGHGRRHADDALPPSVPPTRRPLRRCRLGRRSTRLGKSHYFLLILLPVRASPTPRALRGLVFFAVPSSSIPGPSPPSSSSRSLLLLSFLFLFLFLFLLHWRSLYSSSSSPCYPSGTTTLRGIFSSSRMFHLRVFKGVKSVEIALRLWDEACSFFFFF